MAYGIYGGKDSGSKCMVIRLTKTSLLNVLFLMHEISARECQGDVSSF